MEHVGSADFPDYGTNFVCTDSTTLNFATNVFFTDFSYSDTITTNYVCADSANSDCFTNFVHTNSSSSDSADFANYETSINLPNGTKVVRIIKPSPYPVDSKLCRTVTDENEEKRTANYILGRPRPLPEVEHVSDYEEANDDNEAPPSFSRYSLYAKEPRELADLFFTNSTRSHMQKYFKRRKKEDKEKTENKVPRPFVRRRKKPKNTYVTKEMKLSRVKFEPVPRAKVIDGLLKSR